MFLLKSAVAASLVFFISSPAFSQSIFIGSTEKDAVSLDAGTVRQRKDYVQVWVEYNDLTSSQKSSSSKLLMRFRCYEEQLAISAVFHYSKPNGNGDVISSRNDEFPSYTPVVPGTIGASIMRFACAYQRGEAWAHELVQATLDVDRAVDDGSRGSAIDSSAANSPVSPPRSRPPDEVAKPKNASSDKNTKP